MTNAETSKSKASSPAAARAEIQRRRDALEICRECETVSIESSELEPVGNDTLRCPNCGREYAAADAIRKDS